MKSELVGYVRKTNAGNALKITILKDAIDKAEAKAGKDGKEYISLLINLSKIRMIIGDDKEVTSVCQLIQEKDE